MKSTAIPRTPCPAAQTSAGPARHLRPPRRAAALAALFALGLAIAAPAQEATDAAKAPLQLHILGASVSAGFKDGPLTGARQQGDTVSLKVLLDAWAGEHAKVTMHNPTKMMAMFTNPEKLGGEQIAAVAKNAPDLVLAIDFPFWFAYGYVQGEEGPARRERFAKGLELLGSLDLPIILGDLPDMTGAAARMLSPRQIPAAEVLRGLNAELARFAAARSKVQVLPLGELVRAMQQDGVELPLQSGPLRAPKGTLLQEDRLHANRLGMAYLGFQLQGLLQRAMPAEHPLARQQWSFEQFVAAAGAGPDLEALQDEGPAKPVETGKPAGGK